MGKTLKNINFQWGTFQIFPDLSMELIARAGFPTGFIFCGSDSDFWEDLFEQMDL